MKSYEIVVDILEDEFDVEVMSEQDIDDDSGYVYLEGDGVTFEINYTNTSITVSDHNGATLILDTDTEDFGVFNVPIFIVNDTNKQTPLDEILDTFI